MEKKWHNHNNFSWLTLQSPNPKFNINHEASRCQIRKNPEVLLYLTHARLWEEKKLPNLWHPVKILLSKMSEKDGYFGLGLQTWNLFELDQCRLCSCSYVCHYSYTHILLYYDLKELLAWFMTKVLLYWHLTWEKSTCLLAVSSAVSQPTHGKSRV